jgi:hypothetical protein
MARPIAMMLAAIPSIRSVLLSLVAFRAGGRHRLSETSGARQPFTLC